VCSRRRFTLGAAIEEDLKVVEVLERKKRAMRPAFLEAFEGNI
jgi:hypothetical protein